jgi:ABC-type transport system involved in cytochrome c biogenesis permease component
LVYSVAPSPSPTVWLALLWVVVLFSAMQAAFRAFHEPESLWAYLNQLASPAAILGVKSLQVAVHTLLTAAAALLLFGLFFGMPESAQSIEAVLKVTVALMLGSLAFAATMSFTSALASRAGSNPTLMATLSLPLLLPAVLVARRASSLAVANQDWAELAIPLFGEVVMMGLPLALGSVLMPYLWKQ